jgi:hypothetical protein
MAARPPVPSCLIEDLYRFRGCVGIERFFLNPDGPPDPFSAHDKQRIPDQEYASQRSS